MIASLRERPAGLLTRHFFHALFDFGVFSQEGADALVRVIIGMLSLLISLGLLLGHRNAYFLQLAQLAALAFVAAGVITFGSYFELYRRFDRVMLARLACRDDGCFDGPWRGIPHAPPFAISRPPRCAEARCTRASSPASRPAAWRWR